MQRIRINQMYQREYFDGVFHEGTGKSAELESCFENVLTENSDYMQDDEIEAKLEAKMSGKNSIVFLIGYRSSGKTAFLKKHFKIKYNTAVMQEDSLIVPMLGLGNVEAKKPYDHAVGIVRSMCDILESNGIKYELGIEEFFSFVLETRAEYLPALTFSEECALSSLERKSARIDKMQKEHALSYYLTRLKLLLSKAHDRCSKIVLILDNIQNTYSDPEMQKEFVNYMLHTYECLKNFVSAKLHLIISVRPYNFRTLKGDQHILPYTVYPIWKNNKFNSEKLLEKVLGNYSEEVFFGSEMLYLSGDGIGKLSQKLRRTYSEMIEKICFYDIGLITEAYKRILLNKTWLRKGNFQYKPKPNVCLFDSITLIRALACGNSKIYQRIKYTEDTPRIERLIPNLLYNEENEDYGILILYTMKYFLRKYDKDMECGDKYVQIEDYMEELKKVLNVEEHLLCKTLNYMHSADILRRSIHDVEGIDGEPYNKEFKFGTKNKLYITIRGAKLWDMLKDHSLLMELCREDMYRIPGDDEDSNKSSYDLMMEGKQPKLFFELLEIIKELFGEEYEYYNTACKEGKGEQYRKLFGKSSIIRNTLLQGVTKSVSYAGCADVQKEIEAINDNMISQWGQMGEQNEGNARLY